MSGGGEEGMEEIVPLFQRIKINQFKESFIVDSIIYLSNASLDTHTPYQEI